MTNEHTSFSIESVASPCRSTTSNELAAEACDSAAIEAIRTRARLRSLGRLLDHQVLSELLALNRQQHRLEADLLLFLGELDRRQLYREHAVSSAFEFCVSRLGYSEDLAYKRVGAARLIRRFPQAYDLLVEGRVHLTALMLIKPHLTQENHEAWLAMVCGKSKRRIEKLVAAHYPQPDAPARIRKVSVAHPSAAIADHEETTAACEATAATVTATQGVVSIECAPTDIQVPNPEPLAPVRGGHEATRAGVSPLHTSGRVVPLSMNTYRVTFTATEQLKEKLDRAGELLSHCIRPMDLAALIERALDQMLAREERRRYGGPRAAERSLRDPAIDVAESQHESCQEVILCHASPQDPEQVRVQPGQSDVCVRFEQGKGHVLPNCDSPRSPDFEHRSRRQAPAAVRRAVFERDGGQCTFLDSQGRRCNERRLLELDHVTPHALGGDETVDNLRLRCRAHNQREAGAMFGREWIKRTVRRARQKRRKQSCSR